MSMNLYSLDSISRKEPESAIRIDMQALVLNLLKIEICAKSSRKRPKRLEMSRGSIICAQNLNLVLKIDTSKNRKASYVHDIILVGFYFPQSESTCKPQCLTC